MQKSTAGEFFLQRHLSQNRDQRLFVWGKDDHWHAMFVFKDGGYAGEGHPGRSHSLKDCLLVVNRVCANRPRVCASRTQDGFEVSFLRATGIHFLVAYKPEGFLTEASFSKGEEKRKTYEQEASVYEAICAAGLSFVRECI